jgi:ubiquitin C-terminal hydrolase
LTLPILPNSTLQQLVDDNLAPDLEADSDWVCPSCHTEQSPEITSHCGTAPEVLIVQLVRFKYDRKTQRLQKVVDIVDIGKEIGLNSGTGAVTYQLSAMIVHQGASLQSGHFMALLKLEKGFVLANDGLLERLTWLQLRQLLERPGPARFVPYVLFYESSLHGSCS